MEEKEEIRAAIHGLFTSNVKMFYAGCFSGQWPLRLENKVIARLAAAEARKRRRLRVENAAETIHAFMRSARAREERERITRRAAAKARKRAKVAARRERMHFGSDLDGSTEAEAISGGDAITVDADSYSTSIALRLWHPLFPGMRYPGPKPITYEWMEFLPSSSSFTMLFSPGRC